MLFRSVGEGDVEGALPGAVVEVLAAVDFLRRSSGAPALLVGHGLGGAAVLAAAVGTPEARAVAVVDCPAGEIPEAAVAALGRPLLLGSSAGDAVGIAAAERLYAAALQPKSLVSLGDVRFAGEMLAAWAAGHVEVAPEAGVVPGQVGRASCRERVY